MPTKKKRLTQREKAERAAIKKQLQADGVLPPDKPRLNRKKFAREVWEDFSEMDVYTADFYLRKAIMATVGPELHEVTSEQVGILKLMKLAVETDRFMQQLKTEGREQYSIGEYVEKVYNPVIFQPTRPLRGETVGCTILELLIFGFQPTRPLRGATAKVYKSLCTFLR